MATHYRIGWHSFKFQYGKAGFSTPVLLTEDQREVIEIGKQLLDHIDELAYGGIRHFVDFDILDSN